MTAGTTDKVAVYWYAEPSVLTHRSWCGDYTHTHTHACTRTACTQHSHKHMHPRTHATLTHTHAATHARNTHTLTRTHACMDAHTSTPHDQHTLSRSSAQPTRACAHIRPSDRHIHNQVIPAHGLEPCRACVNLCLSDLLPMRTDRWDPQ